MSTQPTPAPYAVLLAGGTGSRLGGLDKSRLAYQGETLLAAWLGALASHAEVTVVVGPETLAPELPAGVLLTQESPPKGGPAAAVRAGLLALESHVARSAEEAAPSEVLLLAVDVINPAELLGWLSEQLESACAQAEGDSESNCPECEGLLPVDSDGRTQYLASVLPFQRLLEQALSYSDQEIEGKPLRVLFEGFTPRTETLPSGIGLDIDTWDDVERFTIETPDQTD